MLLMPQHLIQHLHRNTTNRPRSTYAPISQAKAIAKWALNWELGWWLLGWCGGYLTLEKGGLSINGYTKSADDAIGGEIGTPRIYAHPLPQLAGGKRATLGRGPGLTQLVQALKGAHVLVQQT